MLIALIIVTVLVLMEWNEAMIFYTIWRNKGKIHWKDEAFTYIGSNLIWGKPVYFPDGSEIILAYEKMQWMVLAVGESGTNIGVVNKCIKRFLPGFGRKLDV